MSPLATSVLVACVLLLTGTALAQAPEPGEPGSFFCRLAAGAAQSTLFPEQYSQLGCEDMEGLGWSADVALGVSVTRTLAVHAEYAGARLYGVSNSTDRRDYEWNIKADLLGVGATYRFLSAGAYASVAAGAAFVDAVANSDDEFLHRVESNLGYGFQGMLGREWPVEGPWSVGVAGQVIYLRVSNPDQWVEKSYGLDLVAIGILFSASYR
jgi:hypothetical protein